MKGRDVLYLGLLLILITALLHINPVRASTPDIVKQQIHQEFDTRYKNNSLNPSIKTMTVEYAPEETIYMQCDFRTSSKYPETNTFHVKFGSALVLHSQENKTLVAAILAHELGHVYTYSSNDHESEFLADEYGLKLFTSSGGTKEQFVSRFIERDSEGSETHPTDRERYKRLEGK